MDCAADSPTSINANFEIWLYKAVSSIDKPPIFSFSAACHFFVFCVAIFCILRGRQHTYDGGSLASFVFKNIFTAIKIKGDIVIIGLNGLITATAKTNDLILIWHGHSL